MLSPEVIGPPDCPLFLRWTLLKLRGYKLLVHRHMPYARDKDCHDHPADFVTVCLWGSYENLVPTWPGEPLRVSDVVRAGTIRFRAAEHAHCTSVGPRGCWTIVLMRPKRRKWGFWRGDRWWYFKDYEDEFGFAMRCEDLPKEYRK
jgi:hypothetical protein